MASLNSSIPLSVTFPDFLYQNAFSHVRKGSRDDFRQPHSPSHKHASHRSGIGWVSEIRTMSSSTMYGGQPGTVYSSNDSKLLSSNSLTPTSTSSLVSVPDYATYPLIKSQGRIFLRDPDNPYPLPCDMQEIHRQTMRSLTLMQVFGGPFCTTHFEDEPPKRVLEVACGSAMWTTACHDHFARKGHTNISFTGLDIINIAPDLRKNGINWQFKRHDLRKARLPFPDEYFDFIFIKDSGTCHSGSHLQIGAGVPLADFIRILRPGGVVEIWDSDVVYRTLLPNPAPAPGLTEKDLKQAEQTGTYPISSATPFAKAQNSYLQDYNEWAQKAFDRRRLTPMPCAVIGLSISSETEFFQSLDSRRIAIPFGEVRWERDTKHLTEDQLALRRATAISTVQMIEAMEPMLIEASGKSRDEWDRWWAGLTADLLQKGGAASGECLEVGAWWAQKI